MKKLVVTFLYSLLFTLPNLSLAQTSEDGWGIGFKVGTTGLGLELTRPLTNSINLRGNYNYFEIDEDIEDTNVSYSGDFRKNSLGLFADWHPWSGGFRVSAGVYHHFDNEISIVGLPTTAGSFEFGGQIFNASSIGSVNGNISFGKTTPYFGIGWGNASQADQKWGFIIELGVQFQDTPDVTLVASNCTLPIGECNELNAAILTEINSLQDDIDDFDLWPVLNIGLSYKF